MVMKILLFSILFTCVKGYPEVKFTDCTQLPEHVTPQDKHACTCTFTPTPSLFIRSWTLRWTDPLHRTVVSETSNETTITLSLPTSIIHENGLPYVCTATDERGLYSSEKEYVPFVAYLPQNVTITSPTRYLTEDKTPKILTCSATGEMAMSFVWNYLPVGAVVHKVTKTGLHTYSQNVTLDPSSLSGVGEDGQKVGCAVTNHDFPLLYQEDEYVLRFHPKPVMKNCMNDSSQYITPETTTVCTCSFSLKDQPSGPWSLAWVDPQGRVVLKVESSNIVDGSGELSQSLGASVVGLEQSGKPFKCVARYGKEIFSSNLIVPQVAPKPTLKDCQGPNEFHPADTAQHHHPSMCTCTFSLKDRPSHTWSLAWVDPEGSTVMREEVPPGGSTETITLALNASLLDRKYSGSPYLCVVSTEVGVFSTTQFVPSLAYGPERVTIESDIVEDPDGGRRFSLQCWAHQTNPAPLVEWTGLTYSVRHSNCTPPHHPHHHKERVFCEAITFPTGVVPKGKRVSCSARNPKLAESVEVNTTVLVVSACTYVPSGPTWQAWLAVACVALAAILVGVYCARMTALHGNGYKPLVNEGQEAFGLIEDTPAEKPGKEVEAGEI